MMIDSNGNDITPICQIADVVVLNEQDCEGCLFKTDGCRKEHNNKSVHVDVLD